MPFEMVYASPESVGQAGSSSPGLRLAAHDMSKAWGAKNGRRAGYCKRSRVRVPIKGVLVHWSDTDSDGSTRSVLGQRGLSTHYEVTRSGEVLEYLNPVEYVAYHAGRANGACIGVDVTATPKQPPTPVQLAALHDLLKALSARFSFPLKWGGNQKGAPFSGVYGHRDVNATACPGEAIYSLIRAL